MVSFRCSAEMSIDKEQLPVRSLYRFPGLHPHLMTSLSSVSSVHPFTSHGLLLKASSIFIPIRISSNFTGQIMLNHVKSCSISFSLPVKRKCIPMLDKFRASGVYAFFRWRPSNSRIGYPESDDQGTLESFEIKQHVTN